MTGKKVKPCTKGPRHKWAHVKNVTVSRGTFGPNGQRVHVSLRGKYQCDCGEIKYAEPMTQ